MSNFSERSPDWTADVLQFWFEELKTEQWFKRNHELDEQIRRRFLGLHGHVAAMPTEVLLTSAATALAGVIVLDQFSRNIFRGRAQAFATDAKALAIAKAALAKGYAASLTKGERLFLYLPFEHCESREAQARSVELVAELADPELTKYAKAHRDVIERFGRFPHRNAVLGRISTEEETAFLEQPGSAF